MGPPIPRAGPTLGWFVPHNLARTGDNIAPYREACMTPAIGRALEEGRAMELDPT
jgi:hypothetical protein